MIYVAVLAPLCPTLPAGAVSDLVLVCSDLKVGEVRTAALSFMDTLLSGTYILGSLKCAGGGEGGRGETQETGLPRQGLTNPHGFLNAQEDFPDDPLKALASLWTRETSCAINTAAFFLLVESRDLLGLQRSSG